MFLCKRMLQTTECLSYCSCGGRAQKEYDWSCSVIRLYYESDCIMRDFVAPNVGSWASVVLTSHAPPAGVLAHADIGPD